MAETQMPHSAVPTAMDMDGAGRQQVLFTFFQELAEPVRKLGHTAWKSRGKLARDVKANILLLTAALMSMPGRATKVVNNPKLRTLLTEEEDPQALAGVLCGTSGALCIGSAGAVIGATVGCAVGTMVGTVPAIFTLGLSIPVGAVIGGAVGLGAGVTVGSSAGFVGGATSGCTVAYFRTEITSFTLYVGSKVYDVYDVVVVRPVAAVKSTTRKVRDSVRDSATLTKEKAAAVGEGMKELASDRRVQVSAVTAGAGAATLGTAGAATGMLAGGTAGALIGVVPALFTFGLSIPIGAMIGGTTGLCVGGATGTTVGFVGGGAAGFAGYTYREAPGKALEWANGKARGTAAPANFIKPIEKMD